MNNSNGQNSDIPLPITEIKHKHVQWTLLSGTFKYGHSLLFVSGIQPDFCQLGHQKNIITPNFSNFS